MMNTMEASAANKSPLGAAVLSTVFPGVGYFYLGNFIKGISYLMLLFMMFKLAAHGNTAVFIIAGIAFYIYQIFDTFDDGQRMIKQPEDTTKQIESFNIPMFFSWICLILGILFLLANFEILLTYGGIAKLWPLILIALGINTIYKYKKNKKTNGGNENE